ncbi:hypothetical protein CK203_109480 [Vitis vinifera]|uniref:Uncharacterized protein n=1 Tax=Vitis vinifera TaxID=29760 RepID=A0A438DQE2_VITVI|nr:hypothetical protein CK203_109480 [Vitis vinifera]
MLQWAIELSEYGIEFQPRLSMKDQVMADFVLEYSRKPIQHKEPSEKEWWTLQVDGASRSSGSGVGLLLQSPNRRTSGASHPAGVPDRYFSIVPKYLAFLRSNSGQEKLEKESLRLL